MNLKNIPKDSGCYLFKDEQGKVIYVGKAKSLDKRVKSYFNRKHEIERTNILVSKISEADFVVTDNEVEALILENNLIKKYKPKYNIDLKDSKRYAYVEVTGEEFPRLLVARKRGGTSKFYGPFVSGMSRDYVLRALCKIFLIRTCKKLPKRRCMRYDIGLCSGPCEGHISKEDYLRNIKSAEMVLKGKVGVIVEILAKRMKEFSSGHDFERALEIREQIKAIKELNDKQKMERDKKYDEDFINWIVEGTHVYLILFNARRGILENKQFFEFEWTPNFLEEFLVQFYSDYDCPGEVVLSEKVDSGLKKFLESKCSRVVVPKAGDKLKLLELVKRNIRLQVFGGDDKVRELGEKLKMNSLPRVIECFDVSHLSGTDVVASMVQFRDGRADKNNYRRFRIRGGDVNDDYAAMSEVVRRRYFGLKEKGLDFPNLIVVDGGKGQLGVVLEVLKGLGLKIPVISLAKREEEVFLAFNRHDPAGPPGKKRKLKLDKKSGALKLLIEIRDEAHRFAINYQRLLRRKRVRSG